MDFKDSQEYKDIQNNKLYAKIAIGGVLALHIVCFFLSKARFVNVGQHPWMWIFPVLTVAMVAWTIIGLKKKSDTMELNPWPYRIGLVLAFFSCYALFYCSTC